VNSDKLKSFAKHYFFGLLTSSWNGAIKAVAAIVGIDGIALTGLDQAVHKTAESARVLNMHEMVAAFLGSFAWHAFIYFYTHPFPETLDANPPIPPAS